MIAATGVLHHPKLPDIDGLDSFEGAMFHSSRWDHRALDGARVGIIGTGSTAVQIVSAVVDRVAKLSLFQRTAQWVMPQENPAYSDEEKAAFRDDPNRLPALHTQLGEMFGLFANAVVDAESPEIKMIEDACLANLETNVHDPELRERLRPDYRAACKRLIISPDFYDAIQRPNAELVTDAIERIEPTAVSARGTAASTSSTCSCSQPVSRPTRSCDRWTSPAATARRSKQAWNPRRGVPVDLDPRLPELLHAQRPQRSGRQLLADRGRGAAVPLRHATHRAPPRRRVPRDQREPRRDGRVRGGAHRGRKQTVWVTGCRSWYLDDRGLPAVWPWSFDRFREEMKAPDPAAYEFA